MASDSGSLATPLALSDIIHTLSPPPSPQAHDSRPQDSSNAGKGEQGEEVNSNAAGSNPNIQVDALQDEDEDMEKEKIPEPATEEDLANIKKRLVEMGVTRDDGTKLATGLNHSSREGELLDMVLTLIRSPRISPSQLAHQASTISSLQTQLQYLTSQINEEKVRWQSEREGWDRMAEALIRQRNKPGSGASPDEELERKCSILEADNRILKDRLQETHNRATALEVEIMKLKPMLLMLPSSNVPLSPSSLSSNPNPLTGKKRKQGSPHTEDSQTDRELTPTNSRTVNGQHPSQTIMTSTPVLRPAFPPSQPVASTSNSLPPPNASTSTNPIDIYRSQYSYLYPYAYSSVAPNASQVQQPQPAASTSKGTNPYLSYTIQNPRIQSLTTPSGSGSSSTTTTPGKGKGLAMPNMPPGVAPPAGKPKQRRANGGTALTSDARTEHLLLASRRIGRERAAFLAGVLQNAEKEKERYTGQQDVARLYREAERVERERMTRLRNGAAGTTYYRSNAMGDPLMGPGLAPNHPSMGQVEEVSQRRGSTTGEQLGLGSQQRQSTFAYLQNSGAAGDLGLGAARVVGTPNELGGPLHIHQHTGSSVQDHTSTQPERAASQQVDQDDGSGPYNPPTRTPRQKANALPNGSTLPATPQQQQLSSSTTQTPLDSLVSAALEIERDEQEVEDAAPPPVSNASGRRRRVAEVEQVESPAPKRRRTTNGTATRGAASASTATASNAKAASTSTAADTSTASKESRVPSALDVLADQAQAAVPMSQKRSGQRSKADSNGGNLNGSAKSVRGGTSAAVKRKSGRGKGKGKAKDRNQEVAEVQMQDEDPEVEEREIEDVLMAENPGPEPEPEEEEEQRGQGQVKEEEPAAAAPVAQSEEPTSVSVVVPRKRGRPRKDKAKELEKQAAAAAAAALAEATGSVRGTRRSRAAALAEEESASAAGKRRRAPPRDRTIPLAASSSVSAIGRQSAKTKGKGRGVVKEKDQEKDLEKEDDVEKEDGAEKEVDGEIRKDVEKEKEHDDDVDMHNGADEEQAKEPNTPIEGQSATASNGSSIPEPGLTSPAGEPRISVSPPPVDLTKDANPPPGRSTPVGEADTSLVEEAQEEIQAEDPVDPGQVHVGDQAEGPTIGGADEAAPPPPGPTVAEHMGEQTDIASNDAVLDAPAITRGETETTEKEIEPPEPVEFHQPLQQPHDQRTPSPSASVTLEDASMEVEEEIQDVSRERNVAPTDTVNMPDLGTRPNEVEDAAMMEVETEVVDPSHVDGSPMPTQDIEVAARITKSNLIPNRSGSSSIIDEPIQQLGEEIAGDVEMEESHDVTKQPLVVYPGTPEGTSTAALLQVNNDAAPPPRHTPAAEVHASDPDDIHSSDETPGPAQDDSVNESTPPVGELQHLEANSDVDPAPLEPLNLPILEQTQHPMTASDNERNSVVEPEAIHDSDLDAEAEEDEDRDAEGEDEDMDGTESTWPHISFSSTEISKSLAAMDSLGEDADAEGEIEDEMDDPPEAIFRPSELVPSAN